MYADTERRWFYILLTVILDTEADEHGASAEAQLTTRQVSLVLLSRKF